MENESRSARARRIGFALGPYVCLVLIGSWVGNVYNDEQSYHAQQCVSLRARAQSVQNMWSRTATYRASHAQHEFDASSKWATISQDLDRDRIGDSVLRAHIREISDKWTQLGNDDTGNAGLAAEYVQELQRDFDRSCGTAPTPQPVPSIVSFGDESPLSIARRP